MGSVHPLDDPALASLLGPHARLAERQGQALRYPVDMCSFVALPAPADPAAWLDLATLSGPGAILGTAALVVDPPPGWTVVLDIPGVQMDGTAVAGQADGEAVVLGAADVPEMLDLVERTNPGPFLPRTVEMGTYLGIRRGGALVAMAGERLHPPGWTEVSAVCTEVGFRGQGLATRLVRAIVAGIRARGETPFLHTSEDNTKAIRLYETLGFRLRRRLTFLGIQVPSGA